MMMTQSLLLAGIGALGGVALAATAGFVRARRRQRRRKRREQLKSLGKREHLDLIGGNLPSDLVDLAARFRGEVHGIDLDDVMIGSDREGRHWLARRKVDGAHHQVFGFEIRGELNVRGLHVEPVPQTIPVSRWQRLLRRRPTTGRLNLRVQWTCEARRVADELTRRSVDRWLKEVAASCGPDGKTPVGLEIHADHAWVHSLVPLEGVALIEFMRRAREMRRLVLDEVMRRPATLATPARRSTAEQADHDRAAKEDTRPVFTVPAAEGAEAGPGAETVQLSAVDLLRESPDPRGRSGRRRAVNDDFEIPEPEERVTLIRPR